MNMDDYKMHLQNSIEKKCREVKTTWKQQALQYNAEQLRAQSLCTQQQPSSHPYMEYASLTSLYHSLGGGANLNSS